MRMDISGPGYTGRSSAFSGQRNVNFYSEVDKGAKTPVALVCTPGTQLWTTAPGIVRGSHVFAGADVKGVLPGASGYILTNYTYIVVGAGLYSINSAGVVSGQLGNNMQTSSGRVEMSDNSVFPTGGNQLAIVDGTNVYIWDVGTLTWFQSNQGFSAVSNDRGASFVPGSLPYIPNGSSSIWTNIAYGNSVFVAAAANTNSVAVSSDGISWKLYVLPVLDNWISMAYGAGVFCLIATNSNIVLTSATGVTGSWTQHTLPISTTWIAIAWDTTNFVAVASLTSTAAISPDGVTWTQYNTMPGKSQKWFTWNAIAWNGSMYCAVGADVSANPVSAVSTDGITWTSLNLMPKPTVFLYYYDIAWNGTVFCAVGTTNNGVSNCTATSTDGVTWVLNEGALPSAIMYGIAWNGTVFCVLSYHTKRSI